MAQCVRGCLEFRDEWVKKWRSMSGAVWDSVMSGLKSGALCQGLFGIP